MLYSWQEKICQLVQRFILQEVTLVAVTQVLLCLLKVLFIGFIFYFISFLISLHFNVEINILISYDRKAAHELHNHALNSMKIK